MRISFLRCMCQLNSDIRRWCITACERHEFCACEEEPHVQNSWDVYEADVDGGLSQGAPISAQILQIVQMPRVATGSSLDCVKLLIILPMSTGYYQVELSPTHYVWRERWRKRRWERR